MSQTEIVKHFANLQSGALHFNQVTFSRKMAVRKELEVWRKLFPNALSMKHPQIVVRPDVEKALYLWVKSMEGKGEQVNGPHLIGVYQQNK